MCNDFNGQLFPRPAGTEGWFEVDQLTGKQRIDHTKTYIRAPELTPIDMPISVSSPKSKISELTLSSNTSICKIPDAGRDGAIPGNFQHHLVSGFSVYPERAVLTKSPIIQVIPMDFVDDPAASSPEFDMTGIVEHLNRYYQRMSSVPLKIQWRIPSKYIRMPKPISDYKIGGNFFKGEMSSTNMFAFARAGVTASDAIVDFTGTDILVFVTPPGTTNEQSGSFMAAALERSQEMITNEGTFYNFLIAGNMKQDPLDVMWNWTHEMTHMFGMTDVRNVLDLGNQDSSPMGVFDLMNSEIAPELLAWERWLLGILDDSQVVCASNTETVTAWIHPVEEQSSGIKMTVIPLSKYKALVIESRRRLGYDSSLGSISEGLLVYKLDTAAIYRTTPMTVIPRNGSIDLKWRTDSVLKIGDTIEVDGYSISNIESGDFGDVVQISKLK